MNLLDLVASATLGYFLGSIPWGLILLKFAGRPDPRTKGSGNIGATNVVRVGGPGLGMLTLLLDAAKGAVPVLLAADRGASCAAVAGLMAVAGHCFPVWLRFRGGKGVATFFGVATVLAWPWGLVTFAATWLATLAATRIVSIASILACLGTALVPLLMPAPAAGTSALGLAAGLVLLRHRSNLARLRQGSEPRMGRPSAGAAS